MRNHRLTIGLLAVACMVAALALTGCPQQQPTEVVDDFMMDLEPMPAEADAGTIEIIGSTTVLPISTAWAEAYHAANPSVLLNVSGGGSGNGIKAVIDNTTDIGQSSRGIKSDEIDLAKANNVDPIEHVVAYDGIAPIVHPSNPAVSLSVEELSDIYAGNVTKWSEVGVTGMANDNIVVIARDSASGTYESWKELVVQMDGADKDRDYSPASLKKNSNRDVRQSVADTPSGIGYIGLGYIDESIRTLSVSPLGGGDPVEATVENVQNGSFPASRSMYYYTNGQPTGVVAAFLEWALGPEGQAIVGEQGFVPLQ